METMDPAALEGHTIKDIKTWGKYLFFVLDNKRMLRVHYGLFGKYVLHEWTKKTNPKLEMHFGNGDAIFWSVVSLHLLEGTLKSNGYLPQADIMDKKWSNDLALEKLAKEKPETLICDALMDQEIFAGLGNIIKNEALYRAGIHPKSEHGKIPEKKLLGLMGEMVAFGQEFLKYRRVGKLKRHLQIYKKEFCPKHKKEKVQHQKTGKTKRESYWCASCQKMFS